MPRILYTTALGARREIVRSTPEFASMFTPSVRAALDAGGSVTVTCAAVGTITIRRTDRVAQTPAHLPAPQAPNPPAPQQETT